MNYAVRFDTERSELEKKLQAVGYTYDRERTSSARARSGFTLAELLISDRDCVDSRCSFDRSCRTGTESEGSAGESRGEIRCMAPLMHP